MRIVHEPGLGLIKPADRIVSLIPSKYEISVLKNEPFIFVSMSNIMINNIKISVIHVKIPLKAKYTAVTGLVMPIKHNYRNR